jgi:hypothetical protein
MYVELFGKHDFDKVDEATSVKVSHR